jgi:hypothetical protein
MAVLSGYLPVDQGIACYAALAKHADATVASGDGRTRDQIMADTMVERLTGQTAAADVNVEVQIMMPLEAVLDPNSAKPATIPGYGPLPTDITPDILITSKGRKWWRRLFTAPSGGKGPFGPILGGDSSRRSFEGWLAHLIRLRDQQTCRSPFCGAPIGHIDHCSPPRRWWIHELQQRPWHLRTLQLRARDARLAHHCYRWRSPRQNPHRSDHHTHRPPLPQPRARPAMSGAGIRNANIVRCGLCLWWSEAFRRRGSRRLPESSLNKQRRRVCGSTALSTPSSRGLPWDSTSVPAESAAELIISTIASARAELPAT